MKTLGIVGGLGPESTIAYYRLLVASFAALHGGRSPALVIDSLDVRRILALLDADPAGAAEYLLRSLHHLAGAGADFALIAANTPHLVFDEVVAKSPLPLLSIVECACDAARAGGLRTLGLLGTRLTMQGGFYQRAAARVGIRVVVPEEADGRWVHEAYVGQLLEGRFEEATQAGVLEVVERMAERGRVDGVLLAGTELGLLIRQSAHQGVALLDTTRLHVQRAIEAMVG